MAKFSAKLTLNMQHMLLISLSAWKTMVPEVMDSQMILRLWKQSLTRWIHWFFNSISLIYFSRFDLVCGVQNYIFWCRDIHYLLDINYPCWNSDCRWSVVCDRWEGVSIPRYRKPPTGCSSGREWLTGLDRDHWYAVHNCWSRYVFARSCSLSWSEPPIAPGAIVVEWNVKQPNGQNGGAGMWDSHIRFVNVFQPSRYGLWPRLVCRLGGAAGTNLQDGQCPKSGAGGTTNCFAAFLALHLTSQSTAYLEVSVRQMSLGIGCQYVVGNLGLVSWSWSWWWLPSVYLFWQRYSVRVCRTCLDDWYRYVLLATPGILLTTLYLHMLFLVVWSQWSACESICRDSEAFVADHRIAVAEHHVMYQYSLVNAKNHWMGLIQTETVSIPACAETRFWKLMVSWLSRTSNLILRHRLLLLSILLFTIRASMTFQRLGL